MNRLVRVERRTCWEENGVCIELESDLFLIEMAADREGAWCHYSDTCTVWRYYETARGLSSLSFRAQGFFSTSRLSPLPGFNICSPSLYYSPFQKNWPLRCIWLFSNVFKDIPVFSFPVSWSCFCPSNISISSVFYLGKATFLFSRENQWFCLFAHKQAFAAGVRRTYTKPTSSAQTPVADDFAQQLYWCDAERTTAKNPRCAGIKKTPNFYFFCQSRRAFVWMRFSFVCLEENVRIPYYVPFSLRHRCRSRRLMFLNQ